MSRAAPSEPTAGRCFVCGARDWRADGALDLCGHCGTRVRRPYDAAACRSALEMLLVPGPVALDPSLPFRLDAYTMRVAASGAGLSFEPADRDEAFALAYPHSERPARGWLRPLEGRVRSVALAMIARAGELDGLLPRLAALGSWFRDVLVIADAENDAVLPRQDGVRVLARPLDGDFGAQRNAGMAASAAQWAFHLDLDETVDDAFMAALSRLAAHAERAGLAAVGFARRNRVDGVLSDHFPDVQYRLVQRDQRFVGRVHERPAACASWPRTTIALHGAIDHHLERARIARRHALHERLGHQGERQADMAALLRPFRP